MKTRALIGLSDQGQLAAFLPGRRMQLIEIVPHSAAGVAMVCLDRSYSMSGEPLEEAKAGVRRFHEEICSAGLAVGLIDFGTSAVLRMAPSRDGRQLITALGQIYSQGSTNMADAIHLANRHLLEAKGQAVMVLASDGMPDDESAALRAARHARDNGIRIIVVAVQGANDSFLGQIASSEENVVIAPAGQIGKGIEDAARLLPAWGEGR